MENQTRPSLIAVPIAKFVPRGIQPEFFFFHRAPALPYNKVKFESFVNLVLRAFLLVQNDGSENPLANVAKMAFVRILLRKQDEMSSFRLNNGFRFQADAGKNLRKSHFIMRQVAKYSTILGVFQQPWPRVSPFRHFE